MYYFDITYVIFVLPAVIFALIAQGMVQSAFKKYQKVPTHNRMTGAMAADRVLRQSGVYDVGIERVAGQLTDHYDPRTKTIRLSEGVYNGISVAAVGIAAHEAGHAVQRQEGYGPMKVRQAIIPVSQVGSFLAMPLVLLGFVFNYDVLINLGILFFGLATLFQLITLPVEFNASRRALQSIEGQNLLNECELPQARKVLRAAAMTYVAALAVSLMQLLRLVILSGNRRSR